LEEKSNLVGLKKKKKKKKHACVVATQSTVNMNQVEERKATGKERKEEE
jgi:hypothetical protein